MAQTLTNNKLDVKTVQHRNQNIPIVDKFEMQDLPCSVVQSSYSQIIMTSLQESALTQENWVIDRSEKSCPSFQLPCLQISSDHD